MFAVAPLAVIVHPVTDTELLAVNVTPDISPLASVIESVIAAPSKVSSL